METWVAQINKFPPRVTAHKVTQIQTQFFLSHQLRHPFRRRPATPSRASSRPSLIGVVLNPLTDFVAASELQSSASSHQTPSPAFNLYSLDHRWTTLWNL